jgi:hypothetical protein
VRKRTASSSSGSKEERAVSTRQINNLTEVADLLLGRGITDIYELTREAVVLSDVSSLTRICLWCLVFYVVCVMYVCVCVCVSCVCVCLSCVCVCHVCVCHVCLCVSYVCYVFMIFVSCVCVICACVCYVCVSYVCYLFMLFVRMHVCEYSHELS